MSTTPILDAELIIATAIRNALAPIAGTYNERPKIYWLQAEQGAPHPLLIAQAQTPIKVKAYIGMVQATGTIVIKALGKDAASARDLLALAAPRMELLDYPEVSIQATFLNSPILQPTPTGVHQSAHAYRITITKE